MKLAKTVLFSTVLVVVCWTVNHCVAAGEKPVVPSPAPETIRGAIYVSFEAFNAPQMWKNFSAQEAVRDFGYARKIHLNALRIWASYEYWKMEPEKFKTAFDQMLDAADRNGIRILISLFENDGVPPTEENMWTTDPNKAFAIESPGPQVVSPDHQERWEEPRRFVKWFMNNYRSDHRLLAVEVMNEPTERAGREPASMPFAKSMFATAKSMQGTVPLTIGTQSAATAERLIPLGLDVIEIHDNFPQSNQSLETNIQQSLTISRQYHVPLWLTEWQRVRPTATGFGKEAISAQETTPDYASLAATVQKYPVGNFFWSLMVKRAYLPPQRAKGTINGLFWPDGTVWSLPDARAIMKNSAADLVEKRTLPPGFLDYLKIQK